MEIRGVGLEDALERAAIPNVTVAGRGFYDRPEVRDILNALHAVADPFDNVALVGLLRSPAVGMTDFAIMQLCDAAPKGERNRPAAGALWTQLQLEAEPRAQEAVTLIRTLNQRAGRVSVAVLLEDFLTRSTYGVALMQAGQARSARNLTKLMDEARAAPSPMVCAFVALPKISMVPKTIAIAVRFIDTFQPLASSLEFTLFVFILNAVRIAI